MIDRGFYRASYDYNQTMRKVSRTITSLFDVSEIYKYVADTVYTILGLESIYVLKSVPYRGFEPVFHKVRRDHRKKYSESNYRQTLRLNKSSEVVRFFSKSDDIMVREELAMHELRTGPEIIDRIKMELSSLLYGTLLCRSIPIQVLSC